MSMCRVLCCAHFRRRELLLWVPRKTCQGKFAAPARDADFDVIAMTKTEGCCPDKAPVLNDSKWESTVVHDFVVRLSMTPGDAHATRNVLLLLRNTSSLNQDGLDSYLY